MKAIACLLLAIFLLTLNCSSQDSAINIFYISKIPPQGIVLDKGWKFTGGDNPAYASPAYDDSKWQAVDPTKDIHYLPQVRNAGVCWFRLSVSIDTTILDKPVAFVVNQIGASEIYLNGRLLQRFGTVSKKPEQLETFNPKDKPLIVQLSEGKQQEIAVRYAFNSHIPYLVYNGFGNPCFSLRLMQPAIAFDNYNTPILFVGATGFFQFGIFLLLSIIHLLFFLQYKQRKGNLYFSIYTFSLSLSFLTDFFFLLLHSAPSIFFLNIQFLLAVTVGNIFLLISINKLFNRHAGVLVKTVILICILTIPFYFWQYEWGWIAVYFSFVLVAISTIWISIVAIKKDKIGAKVVLIGQTIALLFFLIFTYATISNIQSNLSFFGSILYQITFTIAFLCSPVFISFLLAKEFAETNKSLKYQLETVEKLSQKTIAQEQEKQQILATENERLEQQVAQRTADLKQSLEHLKSTQAQLIQSEKMASLGQLTAGIAHEIQNPLNFVNNFSEINTELIEELKNELAADNKEEALLIADDIKDNEQKIIHHGKRADSIVKGMLQHSRASTGKRELTDINALVDECVRLSYYGLRAKNKEFNAEIKTDLDDSIAKINIVPQDISRVLLNLLNNAFYAVNEKKKGLNGTYEPIVSVCTKKLDSKVEILVKDNGNGIPQNIVDKIFQPFFTTKPTGQGTGLGLSLSYDIIKAHGGNIAVESNEGEESKIIIQLPV